MLTLQRLDPVRRSLRRTNSRLRPFRVIVVAWLAMPVPLFVSGGWWLAPAWSGIVVVRELYADLESVALTMLFGSGIVAQVLLWTGLAAALSRAAGRAPQGRLGAILGHPISFLLALAFFVRAWLRPTYLIGDDPHHQWVPFPGLF